MNKRGINKFIWIIGIIVILAIGAFYLFQINVKTTKNLTNITISHTGNPDVGLLLLAQEKGFFKKEGLNVNFVELNSGKESLNSVFNKEADYGVSAEVPIVLSAINEKDFYIISRIFSGKDTEGLIGRKDKGISKIEDLKNKKVGVTKGTSAEYLLDSILKINGLKIEDVEVIDLKPNKIKNAILNGEVDAVSIWHPILYNIKNELGDNGILFDNKELINTYKFYLVSSKQYVDQNAENTKKLISALVNTEDYIKENIADSLKLLSNLTSNDYDYVTEMYNSDFLKIELSQDIILVLEDLSKWTIKNNLTEKTEIPNYLDYIYVDALKEVEPNSIGITGYYIRR